MKFTWLGGATFLLQLGPFRILCDPVFARAFDMELEGRSVRVERVVSFPDADLSAIDVVCASCYRADHFDPGAAPRVGAATPLVGPPMGGAEHGFSDVRSLERGGVETLAKGGDALAIHAVWANGGNGYVFRHTAAAKTYTAYWTGDAVWSDEIRRIQREHGHVNLLIQHVGAEPAAEAGARRSADGKDAMQFVFRMQPNAVVAVHHHTFTHYAEPVSVFADLIARTIYEKRIHWISEGESFEK